MKERVTQVLDQITKARAQKEEVSQASARAS